MDFFVRWVFVPHLPSHRRTRRRTDEEQSARVGTLEVFFLLADGRGFAEVDARACGAEEGSAIKVLSDADRRVSIVEGADYAAE